MPSSNNKGKAKANVVEAFEKRIERTLRTLADRHEGSFESEEQMFRLVARHLGCTRAELSYYENLIIQMLHQMGIS